MTNLWHRWTLVLVIAAGPVASAQTTHTTPPSQESTSPETGSTQPPSRSSLQDLLSSQPQTVQRMQQVVAFWNLAAGRPLTPELTAASGWDVKELRQFRRRLKVTQRPTSEDVALLRKDFAAEDLSNRLAARRRFLNFVAEFKRSFPSLGDELPEILTVWGEARDLGGFKDDDDWLQQAKMASIIHVLRNRAAHHCRRQPNRCLKGPTEVRWRLATRRFQFSAFEPFDPNLAEIAFGPRSRKGLSLGQLPPLDARALFNLIQVLERMNSGAIQIEMPLADESTRHYLTPELVPYSRDSEKKLRTQAQRQRRRQVFRFPKEKPQEIAIVPHWADPDKWIDDPVVVIQSSPQESRRLKIPRSDFIYFRGVL